MFCACCAPETEGREIHSVGEDEAHPGLKEEPAARQEEEEVTTEYQDPPHVLSPPRPEPEVHAVSDTPYRDEEPPPLPLAEDECFEIVLHRSGRGVAFGMVLDPSGSQAIHVCSIQSGGDHAVAEANRSAAANRQEQLQAGDLVVGVNDVSGNPAVMLQELNKALTARLRVSRPMEFHVVAEKKVGSLGCGITYDASTGMSLVIEDIRKGPITEWNDAHPDEAVQVGDRITTVNGCGGDAYTLLDRVKGAGGTLDLTVARPACFRAGNGNGNGHADRGAPAWRPRGA